MKTLRVLRFRLFGAARGFFFFFLNVRFVSPFYLFSIDCDVCVQLKLWLATMEESEEPMCRYCFEGADEGELLSPCKCSGGQKYVHLDCLRRWQRMALVSQPTHPMYYRDDKRITECGVCKSKFTCAPATRHDLMRSFTGGEIAALINEGCIIAANAAFSLQLKAQLENLPPTVRASDPGGYRHWMHGSFLISSVTEDDGMLKVDIPDHATLLAVKERLNGGTTCQLGGQTLRLQAQGSLAGVSEGAPLVAALNALRIPAEIVLAPERTEPPNCGDDHIVAVSLTRCISAAHPDAPTALQSTMARLRGSSRRSVAAAAAHVEISHFIGGPCDMEKITTCLVVGASKRGWRFVPNLADAVLLAMSRAHKWRDVACSATNSADNGQTTPATAPSTAEQSCKASGKNTSPCEQTVANAKAWPSSSHQRPSTIAGGQSVRITGLQSRLDLNGQAGLAIKFSKQLGRWVIRLADGDCKLVKPTNLEALPGGEHGRVMVFWGDARWSRTQLLGEIARGHWGLATAIAADVIADPGDRWRVACYGAVALPAAIRAQPVVGDNQGATGSGGPASTRLAFAPPTEMTESSMRKAAEEMQQARVQIERGGLEQISDDDDDENEENDGEST